jgi:pimeloyl-ACP methyl ester carboxylesterase
MKSKLLILIFLFITHIVSSQENNFKESEIDIPTKTQIIYGTLLIPNAVKKPPLVILIPGSGPTDRDGNNAVMKNNSLKYLAESLSKQKIATYRFDKSVLTFTKKDTLKIKALTFNTFINEATSVIKYFKISKNYSKIIIAGHSQGSLVGMVASKNNADAFISLEGAGRPIDEIIIEQITKQAPYLKEETIRVLKELKQGKLVTDFNPMLISLFNQQVQPFLISWIQYNPQIEIKKLTIPILIIQGTKDIQVSIKDAELLHKANTTSKLKLIENINHIFKEINVDVNEKLQSYSNPKLPITPILTTTILNFINQIK